MSARVAVGLALTLSIALGAPVASQEDDMQAMKAPGAAHRALEPLIGEWDVEMKVFVPGAPQPTVWTGTARRAWAFGHRFVDETLRLRAEGLGEDEIRFTVGHNNWTGEYQWTLVGSHCTASYGYAGAYDEGARRFEGQGSWAYRGPDGKRVTVGMRVVSEWEGGGHDRLTTVVYFTFPGAPEQRSVEYLYARRR